jgi:hypothetical protein
LLKKLLNFEESGKEIMEKSKESTSSASASASASGDTHTPRPWQSYHTVYTNAKAGTFLFTISYPILAILQITSNYYRFHP